VGPFWEEATEEILSYIKMARLVQSENIIEKDPQHLSAALCHVGEIEVLIHGSNSRMEWYMNPEPTFRRAIRELRSLNWLWAQNLASHLQYWLRPIPIL
jgi:hypothetical protein